MPESYSFFNSVGGDRTYQASDFALFFKNFIGNGVFNNPTNALQVTSNNNYTVSVQAGFGYINGYLYHLDAVKTINIAVADSVLNRIDVIVLRLDLTNRLMTTDILQGTPSANPVKPSLTQNATVYELSLAEITVNAAQTSVQTSNISDTRSDGAKCGWVQSTLADVTGRVAKTGDTMTGTLTIKKDVPYFYLDANRAAPAKIYWNASATADYGFIIDSSICQIKIDNNAKTLSFSTDKTNFFEILNKNNTPAPSYQNKDQVSAFSVGTAGTGVTADSVWRKLNFGGSKDYDNKNEFDTVNFKFVAAEAGLYQFASQIRMNGIATGVTMKLALYKNGVSIQTLQDTNSSSSTATIHGNAMGVKANAGDVFEIYYFIGGTGGTVAILNGSVDTYFKGLRTN